MSFFFNLMLSTFKMFSTASLTFRKEQREELKILRLILNVVCSRVWQKHLLSASIVNLEYTSSFHLVTI